MTQVGDIPSNWTSRRYAD